MNEKPASKWLPIIMRVQNNLKIGDYSTLQRAVLACLANEVGTSIVGVGRPLDAFEVQNTIDSCITEIERILEDFSNSSRREVFVEHYSVRDQGD